MSEIEAVIAKCVENIWGDYDKDNSGALDKEETKKFMVATLGEMSDTTEISDEDFQAVFKEFDADGNGTISKTEMGNFIKKVAGL